MEFQINRFLNNFYRLVKVYLFYLAIFTLFRLWFLVRLGDFKELVKLPADVTLAFLRGMQFDTMIICYLLLIPFLLCFAGMFTRSREYIRKSRLFISWYSVVMLAIALIILFVDQYYYNYFQTHISVIIFGLADDDSQTVMSSVWTDYPIIRISLVWIGLILGFRLFIKKVFSAPDLAFPLGTGVKFAALIVIPTIFFLGIRESVGTYPLRIQDSQVSDNKFVNFLTINGIYALKNSYRERKESENIIENELKHLRELGYENPASAARDYFAGDSIGPISDSDAFERLFDRTAKNTFLERNRPNVVFVFMESMSNYNMDFDSEQMNLLGSLRKHIKSDILFRNFVSSGNTTIQSLEYLMVNSPVNLSQSKYRFTSFPSSVAIPFKNSGYQTNFITGGKVNWRAMDNFAANQRFDRVKGMSHIQTELTNCQSNKWGVYDEYLFDYVYEQLTLEKKQPKFFFVQTTTNHTPFELPLNYKPLKINIADSLKERLLVKEELAVKNLNAYQYANNSLGNFLDKIKRSELGKNTIVVMTGDHNNLMLFDFDENHQLQQRGVPLYMYIPEKYKPETPLNTEIFASHKDIFPTIFNLSLSDTKYFSVGNNLFDLGSGSDKDKYFGMNIGSSTSFSDNAAVNYSPLSAFYTWQNKGARVLGKIQRSTEAEQLLKRSRANYALSMFYILNEIQKDKSQSKPARRKKLAQL